ncbi:hypothetical protein J7J41_00470 [bacterium]|nr:hypothetical protein [bacterium]
MAKVLTLKKPLNKKEKTLLNFLVKKISFSRKISPLVKTTNLGDIYLTLKNFPLAERYFKKALILTKKKEEKMVIYANLLILHFKKKIFKKLPKLLKKLKKLNLQLQNKNLFFLI